MFSGDLIHGIKIEIIFTRYRGEAIVKLRIAEALQGKRI
jgi:hypothetical protein